MSLGEERSNGFPAREVGVRDAGICSPRGTRCRSLPPNPRCNPVRVVGAKGGAASLSGLASRWRQARAAGTLPTKRP